jgi:hypothetical protein
MKEKRHLELFIVTSYLMIKLYKLRTNKSKTANNPLNSRSTKYSTPTPHRRRSTTTLQDPSLIVLLRVLMAPSSLTDRQLPEKHSQWKDK